MNLRNGNFLRYTVVCAFGALLVASSFAVSKEYARKSPVSVNTDSVSFLNNMANGVSATLTITGPDMFYSRQTFAPGEPIEFGVLNGWGETLSDGAYKYELTFNPAEQIRDPGQQGVVQTKIARTPVITGTVSIRNGMFANPKAPEAGLEKDQVILDDLIVDGSLCVGQDCVNGESFGFDTIRLKENNLRIKFQDTSSTASFPTNDWQITANDSANGGANKFSIDDIDGGRTPFTIEAGAPSNSLYVDDGGRIGLGTSTPVAEIHTKDGDTPTLRLEQDGSSGFTPQTWDVAGNEAGFFVRDATNGSTLPFRIRPGAPSSAIDIAASGNVGIGAASPSAPIHVRRTDGTAEMLVEEAASSNADRLLFEMINKGPIRFRMTNTDTTNGNGWVFKNANSGFQISRVGSAATEFEVRNSGNVVISGTLTEGSSRSIKKDISILDGGEVLAKLMQLPIAGWKYIYGDRQPRHIGPMAEDFYALFGLGPDDKHLSARDLAGVTTAATQELARKIESQGNQLRQLREQNQVLVKRLANLERRVSASQ